MKRYAAALAAATLVTLGACSNGDSSEASGSDAADTPPAAPSDQATADTPEEVQAKADIREGILERGGGLDGVRLSEEQAGCLADGLVDRLGVEKLRDYRLLTKNDRLRISNPTDLDPGDADTVASTFVDCVDLGQLVTAELGDVRRLGNQAKQCIEDAIDQDTLRRALSDSLQGRDPDFGGMQQELARCGAGNVQ